MATEPRDKEMQAPPREPATGKLGEPLVGPRWKADEGEESEVGDEERRYEEAHGEGGIPLSPGPSE